MTTNDRFEPGIANWLHDDARHHVPEHLAEVLAVTAKTRQRPAWSSPERWLPVNLTIAQRAFPMLPSRRTVVLIAVVVALTALIAVAVGAHPTRLPAPFGPAANGSILFDKDGDIFTANPDGTRARVVLGGAPNDFAPWYSHDGTRFVFWRDVAPTKTLLMMADADGSNVRSLVGSPLVAADWYEFSPGDDKLAIVHEVRGLRVLSVLDIASGSLTQLDVRGLNVDNDALWLPPTGDELIFTARANATSSTGAAIYGIRPDGTGLRTIVPEPSEEWAFLDPDLAPDGRTLTYWMYEKVAGSTDPHARIHLVDVATGKDRVARFDPTSAEESELHFSPDGKTGTIVEANARATMAIVDIATEALVRRVGPSFAGNEGKSTGYSPDGTKVFLAFDDSAPKQIDVATGTMDAFGTLAAPFSTWQRLAP